jgi:hypothetical protein
MDGLRARSVELSSLRHRRRYFNFGRTIRHCFLGRRRLAESYLARQRHGAGSSSRQRHATGKRTRHPCTGRMAGRLGDGPGHDAALRLRNSGRHRLHNAHGPPLSRELFGGIGRARPGLRGAVSTYSESAFCRGHGNHARGGHLAVRTRSLGLESDRLDRRGRTDWPRNSPADGKVWTPAPSPGHDLCKGNRKGAVRAGVQRLIDR